MLKLEPQPHEPFAFEFVNLKPGSIRSFEKSIERPSRNTELTLSETLRLIKPIEFAIE